MIGHASLMCWTGAGSRQAAADTTDGSSMMDLTPETQALYQALLDRMQAFGTVGVVEKKTAIHLHNRAGFAGVHPRKSYVYLTIVSDQPIVSPRIAKTEQVSKSRFHNEIKIAHADDIDAEVLAWLRTAYQLMA
jgi:hypothetical protein